MSHASALKRGTIKFADSNIQGHIDNGMCTPIPLRLPQRIRNGKKDALAYLTVPLLGIEVYGMGRNQSWKPYNNHIQPTVLFDSGSEGVFVIDDTYGSDGTSILESTPGINTRGATYLVHVGIPGGNVFTVVCPPEWRGGQSNDWAFRSDSLAVSRQEFSDKWNYSQMLVLGNVFMTCLSITYELSSKRLKGDAKEDYHAYFMYLNGEGNPSKVYAGPRSPIKSSRSHASLLMLPISDANIPNWTRGGYAGGTLGNILKNTELAADAPSFTDVTLKLKFTTNRHTETESANVPSLPNLPVYFKNCVAMMAVLDTGSQTSIFKFDECTPTGLVYDECITKPEKCNCTNADTTVFDVFRGSKGGKEQDHKARFKGDCKDPFADAGCNDGVCCTKCCLPKGVTETTFLKCAIPYCTGVLSYKPAIATLSLDHEKLKDVPSVNIGHGETVCDPLDVTGIIGMCFWTSEILFGSSPVKNTSQTSFAFSVLSHLGQINGKYNNFTIAVYRTDALTAADDNTIYPGGPTPTIDERGGGDVNEGVRPPEECGCAIDKRKRSNDSADDDSSDRHNGTRNRRSDTVGNDANCPYTLLVCILWVTVLIIIILPLTYSLFYYIASKDRK
jgi:hypothetical protein